MMLAALPFFISLYATPVASQPVGRPGSRVRVACGTMLMPTTNARPDPFTVDPTDVKAILDFIHRVAPFPRDSKPWAMQDGLKRFWRVYLPHLTDPELDERLRAFDGSSFALQVVRRVQRESVKEKGRLRLTWVLFLKDVAHPSNPPLDPRLAEHARGLMLRRSGRPIVEHLRSIVPFPVEASVASVTAAVEYLWTRDIGGTAPDLTGDLKSTTLAAITAVWDRYVAALIARPGGPLSKSRSRSSRRLDRVGDVFEVEPDAGSIAVDLITRFPDVIIGDDALTKMFVRLRAMYHLAPRDEGFGTKDLHRILYGRVPPLHASARLEHAWIMFIEDLSRTERMLSAAE